MGQHLNNHEYTENYYVRTGLVTVLGCRHCPWASAVETKDAQGYPWILFQTAENHSNCLNNNDVNLLVGSCKCEGWRQGHWNTCQPDLTLQAYALSAGKTTSSKKLRTGLCGISAIDYGSSKKSSRALSYSPRPSRAFHRRASINERDSSE